MMTSRKELTLRPTRNHPSLSQNHRNQMMTPPIQTYVLESASIISCPSFVTPRPTNLGVALASFLSSLVNLPILGSAFEKPRVAVADAPTTCTSFRNDTFKMRTSCGPGPVGEGEVMTEIVEVMGSYA